MADPISIIGTAGALANIIQLATQAITAMRELQSDWKDADLIFLSLTGQLSSLRLALTKINEWMALETGAHYQLVMDLDDSIKCCNILLTKLQELVGSLHQKQNSALNFQSKIKLAFGKKSIDDIQNLLEHQTNALNLLLTACNCKTSAEQKALLERSSSQKILRQTNLDSASLMAQYDTNSIASQFTDTLSRLSLSFSFDREIFTSNVYERFFRGLTKRHLDDSHTRASAVERETVVGNEWELFQQKFLFIGSEYSGIDATLHEIADTFKNPPIHIHLKLQQMVTYRFVILTMKSILTALNVGGINFQSDINTDHSAFLLQYADDMTLIEPLDVRVGEAVRSLWQDQCMERVRQSPQNFGIDQLDTIGLLDELDRIFSREYHPTSKDMQTVQNMTPAIMEVFVRLKVPQGAFEEGGEKKGVIYDFQIRDVTLRFRSNRPYCFKAITAIIVPIDLAGYDNVLAKEPLQTALLHCTSKLKATLQSAWFPTDKITAMYLTRPDDFDTKLATHPFADYYPGYTGVNEPDIINAAVWREFLNLRRETSVTAVLRPDKRSSEESTLGMLITITESLSRLYKDPSAWLRSQGEGTYGPPKPPH
ncbi:G-protein alpha subunit-domain-containing protein [Aspergillus varians]